MAHSNSMTNLINKIESKLGLIPLTPHLPEQFNKEAWADVICDQSLMTFSRFFPWKVPFKITEDIPKIDGWYVIDEEKYFGKTGVLLGIQDIDWADFSTNNMSLAQIAGYGSYVDFYGLAFSFEDILGAQMRADSMSLFNYGVYIEYREPNKFRLKGLSNSNILQLNRFVVSVLLKHPDNLMTISPTKMETFEELAKADVANFLARNLKYWDQMETVFQTIDLKLSDLESAADKRETIVEQLKNSYVTADNDTIPYIITV